MITTVSVKKKESALQQIIPLSHYTDEVRKDKVEAIIDNLQFLLVFIKRL